MVQGCAQKRKSEYPRAGREGIWCRLDIEIQFETAIGE